MSITLQRIGVVKDHDPLLKKEGEIYIYLAISDGKSEPQIIRIPSSEYILLNDNESKEIHQTIFTSNPVGDEIKFVALAFESDDPVVGFTGKLLVQGLKAYLSLQYGIAGQLVSALINTQPSESEDGAPTELAESSSDDFVGGIEKSFTSANKWGEGSNQELKNGDFRLWLTSSIPR